MHSIPQTFTPRNTSALTQADIQHFWSYIDKSAGPHACWPWTGNRNYQGYGRITFHRQQYFAHRLLWFITYGEVLSWEQCLLHSCDNPACCNDAHLSKGTRADNMVDRALKGRYATQSRKLTPLQVNEIRAALATGTQTQTMLARQYGVSQGTINSIGAQRVHVPYRLVEQLQQEVAALRAENAQLRQWVDVFQPHQPRRRI